MTAKQLVRRAAAVLALVVTMPLGGASAAGRPDVEGTAAKPTIVSSTVPGLMARAGLRSLSGCRTRVTR